MFHVNLQVVIFSHALKSKHFLLNKSEALDYFESTSSLFISCFMFFILESPPINSELLTRHSKMS
jgi:hypothetical protein